MEDKHGKCQVERMLKSLVSLFDCTICYNPITQPSQMKCGHIFCSSCIKTITLTEKADAKCPNCRNKLNRRAVRARDDITELNLAVRYLEETLMGELSKDDQPVVENCADLEEQGFDSDVSSIALTQSQPMDLTMPIDDTNMNQFDGEQQRLERSTIKFVEPLDLSTKKRAREITSDVYQQPVNWRRSHPVFIQEDRELRKRQKLQGDLRSNSTDNYYQPIPMATSPAMMVNTSAMEKGPMINSSNDATLAYLDKVRTHASSSSTPPIPMATSSVMMVNTSAMDKGPINTGNDATYLDTVQTPASSTPPTSPVVEEIEAEKESVSDSDEDQVIPCTPIKSRRPTPTSPDSSCSVNNNNNNDAEVVFNSRSTFASPLPSQWNINLSLGLDLESEKNETQPKRKFIMCPSRLNRVELAKLSELRSICEGTISKDYTDEVTHLIIKLEKGRVPQTMKYLFAIADKKWIVVYDWVSECAMQAEMVSEEPYESSTFPDCDSGVRKSRVNPSQLFHKVHFYFPAVLKSSGASNEDCKKLVEKMGGIVVNSLPDVPPETGLIIIGEGGFKNKHLYQEWYKSPGCLTVSWTWVLDCLLTYNILPFTKSDLLTKLDGSRSINLPAALFDANSCTPLSSHFNSHIPNSESSP